ncbi:MAG: ABC transporter ATP-binding protein [Ilumatobacteraceae bacterium]
MLPVNRALIFRRVSVRHRATVVLDEVDLSVGGGERWLVLGANGSGKTTLLRLAALYDHPTSGTIDVLGERLGRVDVRPLRRRIGYLSSALTEQLRPALTVFDVVRTARFGALEPWWERYGADDDARTMMALDRMRMRSFAERPFGSLSSGERQRVLLARTLVNEPQLVLLDEPAARLDLGGREELVAALDAVAGDRSSPPLVLVTHHVEDIPPSMTHVALLRAGRVLRSGPIDDTLDSAALSECFGLGLQLDRRAGGRFSAWAR